MAACSSYLELVGCRPAVPKEGYSVKCMSFGGWMWFITLKHVDSVTQHRFF